MDPVSAAGIGLSVTSLVLQLFEGCIKSYQIMLDVVNMPKQVEPLRVRMHLEQIRLLEWGEKVGLLEDVLQQPSITLQLHRNIIIDVLLQIQDLFKDCLNLDTKYGASVVTNPSHDAGNIKSGPDTVGHRPSILLAKALKVAGKTAELPKRLEWAMVKQEHFTKLVGQLISYNDSIVSLLDRVTMTEIHEMQIQSNLIMLQLSSQIEDLRQLTQAMQVKPYEIQPYNLAQRTANNSTMPSKLMIKNNDCDSLASLAKFKADQMVLESSHTNIGIQLLKRADIKFADEASSRQTGTYLDQTVWIEWKEYNKHSPVAGWGEMIETRVKKLSALLEVKDKPAEFRAPDCLGCFHDEDDDLSRYGLVYSMPKNVDSVMTPVSLLDSIRMKDAPSLTQRFHLAAELARSIMYLHSVNWLHKGIRSDNIVFFMTEKQSLNYTSPTVSGFEYARPDLPSEMTEKPMENLEHDIYRHEVAIMRPEARSQKSWDIYSLGIVLIEIGFWQSIDKITEINLRNQKMATSRIRKMRSSLLEESFLTKLERHFGEKYREVVRRCISGGRDLGLVSNNVDESDPEVGAELLRGFSHNVVAVLSSLSV